VAGLTRNRAGNGVSWRTMSEPARRESPKAGTVSLRALFKLHVAANKPLELEFPSGKVVMSVAEMKQALQEEEAAERKPKS
jgi:hypothetical protein